MVLETELIPSVRAEDNPSTLGYLSSHKTMTFIMKELGFFGDFKSKYRERQNSGALGMETKYNENFLESIMMTPVRTSSNGGYGV